MKNRSTNVNLCLMTFDSNLMHWVISKPLVDDGGSLLENDVSWRQCFLTGDVVLDFNRGWGSDQNSGDHTLKIVQNNPQFTP